MAAILYESYYGIMPFSTDFIQHYGAKGMKWGNRRWQNEDGSLTPAGRAHYGVGEARNSVRTDKDRQPGSGSGRYPHGHKPSGGSTEFSKASNLITDLASRNASRYEMAKAVNDTMERIGDRREITSDDIDALDTLSRKAGFKDYSEAERYQHSVDKQQRKIERSERKAEKARAKIQAIIDSGNLKKIQKNARKMTPEQIREAMEKASIVSQLNQTAFDDRKSRRSAKLDNIYDTVRTVKRASDYMSAWNDEREKAALERQISVASAKNRLGAVKEEIERRLERKEDKKYEREQKALERKDAIDKWNTERRDRLNERDYQREKEKNERDYQRGLKAKERIDRIAKEARERYDTRLDKNISRKDAIDKWNTERSDRLAKETTERTDRIAKDARERYDKRETAKREDTNKDKDRDLEKYKNDNNVRMEQARRETRKEELKSENYRSDAGLRMKKEENKQHDADIKLEMYKSDAAVRLEEAKQRNARYMSGDPNDKSSAPSTKTEDEKKKKQNGNKK